MTSTTVVDEESLVEADESFTVAHLGHRFSWSAIIAGALVATAVTFFLLALGSGVGLTLASPKRMDGSGTVAFLTLGAIYFFAAQAFGFAAGAHLTGRLMGPVLENRKEEEFLAGSHGLVMWALAVVASAVLIYLGALTGTSAALGSAMTREQTGAVPADTGYWVDRLFRPQPEATHATLGYRKYAQVDTGVENDASPSSDSNAPTEASPVESQSSDTNTTTTTHSPLQGRIGGSPIQAAPYGEPVDTTVPTQPVRNIAADKAEASRILTAGMTNGGNLSDVDRVQLAHLVSLDTGLTEPAAENRVKTVEGQIHVERTRALENARKSAAYASLWTALALLFGGIVATMAAVSARWEDDRITFGFGRR
jgi:hypothetical protein